MPTVSFYFLMWWLKFLIVYMVYIIFLLDSIDLEVQRIFPEIFILNDPK